MNKTVTVNLGGTVFHIDDDAYEALIKYLNAIKVHFSAEQGRDEIMQDIESRIGEMFRERMKDTRQVISNKDVDEVTLLMGRPEEFAGEEGDASKEATSAPLPGTQTYKRRMFRDPDDKVLGGVCSGIAAYFDVDPVWVRLSFAGIFFLWGTGFMLYIILWIILPEAKTTADKLMMKGEPVTVSNIEKNVKEELEAVKQRLQEGNKQGIFRRLFGAIGEIFKFLFIAIGKIIAVFFVLIGLIVGFALFASLFGLAGAPFVHYPEFIDHIFVSQTVLGWTFFGMVLCIGIPFLMLAYAGARMLFNLKKGSKIVGFSALGLWIIGVLIVLLFGVKTANQFSEEDNFRKEIALQQLHGKTFVLATNEKKNDEKDYFGNWSVNRNNNDWDMDVKNGKLISRNVKLDIIKSPTDSFDIVEIFYARGSTRKQAIDNATMISYSFSQSDTLIRFDRHYTIGTDARWRAQKVQLLLRVPIGGRVYFDESLRHLIYDIDNVGNIYDNDMLDRTWEMTDKGLTCMDCTGNEKTIDGKPMIITSDDGSEVKIDDEGVRIHSKNGDKVIIDKSGLHVTKKGKETIKIDESGVKIDADTVVGKK